MTDIYESENYEISYRAVKQAKKNLKLYTDKDEIEIEGEISFDIDARARSSMDYFAASVMGGLVCHIMDSAHRKNILLEDIEGKLKLNLKNPLTVLGVKGYDEFPYIESCEAVIYVYSDIGEKELYAFLDDSLKSCFIYQTLERALKISVRFVLTL